MKEMTKANGAAMGITMYMILLSLLLFGGGCGGCGGTLDDEGVTEGDEGVLAGVKAVWEDDKVKMALVVDVIFAVVDDTDVFGEGVTEEDKLMEEDDEVKMEPVEFDDAISVISVLANKTNSFNFPQFDTLNTYKTKQYA